MSPLVLIGAAAFAATLGFLLTPVAGWLSTRVGAIDRPGPRKIHQVPIPRLGGIAVVTAIAATIFVMSRFGVTVPASLIKGLGFGVIPVLVISIIDDIRSVPAMIKFAAHAVAATIAVSFGLSIGSTVHILGVGTSIAWFAVPISWLWIVGVTNAFNLTDGLDGLAAGLALISASSLAAVALVTGDWPQALLSTVVAGALIGFLPYNSFPAKIFFGDTGAATIGFTLACLGLWGTSRLTSGMAVLVPILVMGIPVADALVTIGRRSLGRSAGSKDQRVFQPDQEHIHHRLLRRGLSHRHAVFLLYATGILLALIGVLSIFLSSGRAAFIIVTVLVAATLGIRELEYEEFNIVRNGLMLRMYDMPALRTGAFRVFSDLALVGLSIYVAFALKFDEWGLREHREMAVTLVVTMFPVTVLVSFLFGVYRRSWRHISVEDLLLTVAASLGSSAVGLVVTSLVGPPVPWLITYFLIYTLLFTACVLAVRSSFRVLLYWKESGNTGERVLVYGADLEGAMALQELFWNRAGAFRPVGFIDDDPRNMNRLFNGFRVFGSIHSLKVIAVAHKATGLVIGSSKISDEQELLAQRACDNAGISLRRLRMVLHALPTGEVRPSDVHESTSPAAGR